MDTQKLLQDAELIREAYAKLTSEGLNLDLTRGKPSAAQLDLSNELLDLPGRGNFLTRDGVDTRNYGGLVGITEIRQLWADAMGLSVDDVIAADASSLNIEFDLISWAYHFGTNDSDRPWSQEEKVKWICPVPGYDRHFSITELFGAEMITVDITDDGVNLEQIRELVKDPQVKGMWVVPMFSNPTGVTFSEDVCRELASMDTAAKDFRIMWDNAYAIHTLTDSFPPIHNVIEMAAEAGNPNRFWCFGSTSKITFAGAGVAFFASSPENLDWYKKIASIRGIGPNKVNQLAHAHFFGDADGLRQHMQRHAESLAPKFQAVLDILDQRLTPYQAATWTRPEGGYFISLDVTDGTAARVVELAKAAGIALTAAGSTFPHKNDPNDRNLRLAPSLPPVSELRVAMDGVATCVLLAALEQAQQK